MFYVQIVNLCNENGTTITAVTKELGFSTGSMSQWKNGSEPKSSVIEKFADYFGVTTDYLLGRSDNKTPGKKPGNKKGPQLRLLQNHKGDDAMESYSVINKLTACQAISACLFTHYFTKSEWRNEHEKIEKFAKEVHIDADRVHGFLEITEDYKKIDSHEASKFPNLVEFNSMLIISGMSHDKNNNTSAIHQFLLDLESEERIIESLRNEELHRAQMEALLNRQPLGFVTDEKKDAKANY